MVLGGLRLALLAEDRAAWLTHLSPVNQKQTEMERKMPIKHILELYGRLIKFFKHAEHTCTHSTYTSV